MLTQERYQMILDLVEQRRAVTVAELAHALNASPATVRRDLNALDELGRLQKVHGGATARTGTAFSSAEEDVATKAALHVAEKEAVGRYAAGLIADDDFVYLDAGTTTGKVIDHVAPGCKATFVTNGVDHAIRLTRRGLKTFILGGQFKSTTEAIVGATALQSLRQYNFTKALLGTNGIHPAAGLTTPDPEEAMLKGEVMARSYLTYVLADASKFGRVSSLTFGALGKACVVTDTLPDPQYRELTVVKEVMAP